MNESDQIAFDRVDHKGGGFCICESGHGAEIIGTDDPDEYTITTVYMTREQFDNLPEFQGF